MNTLPQEIRTAPAPAPAPPRAPGGPRRYSVELTDVWKAFGSNQILGGIDVGFAENAITTVLGPSGTGKSVLLKHVMGLLEPDAGQVRVFGSDIWKLKPRDRYALRQRCGVLFQDGALFGSMNIFDNVAFPLRKHTDKPETEIRDIVLRHLRALGLERAADRAPGEISGGMRKRAGFARALVLNPDLLMFDEPDSGLDPVRTSLLCDLILEMHSQLGGCYVVITHDIASARKVSDYVAVLWKGRIVYYGAAKDAFECPDPFVQQFLSGSSSGPLGMD